MHVAHRHRFPHSEPGLDDRPDPIRVLGYSTAILANACVLALLLAPLSFPEDVKVPRRDTGPVLVVPVEPRPILAPAAPPQVQPPRPAPAAPRPQATTDTFARPPVVVENGILPMTVELPVAEAIGTAAAASGISTNVPAGPAAGPAAMRLEYTSAPPPAYPRDAMRRGAEGTVLLQVLVATDGRPLEVAIRESSGHRDLDAAARRHVLARWRFRPAHRDGQPVQAIGLVPIAFSLQ
jgi:periplasmic protein TonB